MKDLVLMASKIGSGLGFLKNFIQDERIQSKEEGSDGFSRVIWEISDDVQFS